MMQELEFNIMTMIKAHLPVVLAAAFTTRAALTKTATAVKCWSILPSDWKSSARYFYRQKVATEFHFCLFIIFGEYVGGTNQQTFS